ncbi:MAG: hypothetical protein PHW66_09490 [Gallionella sp.]|nr:hypothetical protein [Gallionella sp.]
MKSYQVIVGNIGTVLDRAGPGALAAAHATYREYCALSRDDGGHAAGEPVTMVVDGEIVKEYRPPVKLPSIKDVAALVRHVKAQVPQSDPDYIADEDDKPGIDLTIGVNTLTGEWSWQTGDNSYTGGAYGCRDWGVTRVYRATNSRECARDLINQVAELNWG